MSTTLAQTVGPGTVTSTVNVGSGTTTIVGGTSVTPSGTAVLVTGGTLIVDPAAGASPGAGDAVGDQLQRVRDLRSRWHGQSGQRRYHPDYSGRSRLSTMDAEYEYLRFVSTGGPGIHTTGGYGNVGGLPVGPMVVVASHNSSISLTTATILTEGVVLRARTHWRSHHAEQRYGGNSRRGLFGQHRNYGAYGLLSNALNGVCGCKATINGGTFLTAGRTGYGLIAVGSDIAATGVTVATNGSAAYAAFANNGSDHHWHGLDGNSERSIGIRRIRRWRVHLYPERLDFQDYRSHRLQPLSYGANSRLSAENVIVTTTNSGAPGVTAWGHYGD